MTGEREAPAVVEIRPETSADAPAIGGVTTAAFAIAPHASGTEAAIVDALRQAGALTISLVAEEDGAVVGHVAVSPVLVDERDVGWFALGPIAVRPDRQRRGIGAALMDEALARLRSADARGVALVGDPAFYRRFGFVQADGLVMPGVPPQYVLALAFASHPVPTGRLGHHDAFGVSAV